MQVAPNASVWRQQSEEAEALSVELTEAQAENVLLREEIERLKEAKAENESTVRNRNDDVPPSNRIGDARSSSRVGDTGWRTFTATAYTANCAEGCTGITATGLDVRNTTHVNGLRVIATDPTVIPLGTTVEIRFGDGSTERAVAADTGGAIDGSIIDYLVSNHSTAIQFGRKSVAIRILEEA